MSIARGLDDVDQGDAPAAIGQTLTIAKRWVVAS